MAGFSIYDDDFAMKLDRLSSGFDIIAETALNKASPYLKESLKREARNAVRHEGDSEMVNSIKAKKAKKSKNGAWIANVIPTGYSSHTFTRTKGKKVRKYKVTNAAKMIWLEYGNRGGKQPARPFIKKATNDAEAKVLETIQNELDRKVDSL
ncbi:MAG: hypothetical protein K5770_14040 [Lachnospiraceae bacterium]|nr:hypothetical protein [Lachnospiraceae bacterium]